MMTIARWTENEYVAWFAKNHNRAAVPSSDMEPNFKHGSAAKDANKKAYPRYRIHYHSRRRRRCDPDGVYSKAATDGLVAGGLLPNDSLDYISAVEFSQELSETEETIIEIEAIS